MDSRIPLSNQRGSRSSTLVVLKLMECPLVSLCRWSATSDLPTLLGRVCSENLVHKDRSVSPMYDSLHDGLSQEMKYIGSVVSSFLALSFGDTRMLRSLFWGLWVTRTLWELNICLSLSEKPAMYGRMTLAGAGFHWDWVSLFQTPSRWSESITS